MPEQKLSELGYTKAHEELEVLFNYQREAIKKKSKKKNFQDPSRSVPSYCILLYLPQNTATFKEVSLGRSPSHHIQPIFSMRGDSYDPSFGFPTLE